MVSATWAGLLRPDTIANTVVDFVSITETLLEPLFAT